MTAELVNARLLARMRLPEPQAGSKEGRGCVSVVGGCMEVPGAALLAAVAALRAGAGKLQVTTARSVALHLGLALPEALVIAAPETPDGQMARFPPDLLRRVVSSDAVLVGPGMMGDACRDIVSDILEEAASTPVVLDAGAITALGPLEDRVRVRDGRVVMTPHAGEMAKLLGRDRQEIEENPAAAAREAARRFAAVVVMKGASTTIVEPSGTEWRYEGGCVGLGTSGSGDVLAGLIAGLLARGSDPVVAAIWGVYLHGEAGTKLAARGPLGFLAREIATEVPALMDANQAVEYCQ